MTTVTREKSTVQKTETGVIQAFLTAWKGGDKEQIQRLRGELKRISSSDSHALLACHDLSLKRFYPAGRCLQSALEFALDEWKRTGRARLRPSVEACVTEADRTLEEIKRQHPQYEGLDWLEALLAALRGDERQAGEILDGIAREDCPKWFMFYLDLLGKSLHAAQHVPKAREVHSRHIHLTQDLHCPLFLTTEDGTMCHASTIVDAPREPENAASCTGAAWPSCPYFRRARHRRWQDDKVVAGADKPLSDLNRAFESDQIERAGDLAEAGIRLHPLHDEFRYVYGLVLRRSKQPALSYQQCAIAAEIKNDEPAIQAMLAATALHLGEAELAELHSARGLRLNSEHPSCLKNMAEALRMLDRRDESIDYYGRACRANPDDLDWWHDYLNTLSWLGRFDEALRESNNIPTDLSKNDKWRQFIAELEKHAAILQANRKDAEDFISKIGDPSGALTHLTTAAEAARYARDLEITGRHEDAALVSKHLAKQPHASPFLDLLKATRLFVNRRSRGDLEEAARLCENALHESGEKSAIYSEFGLVAAQIHFYLEQYETALQWTQGTIDAGVYDEKLFTMASYLMNLLGRSQSESKKILNSYSKRLIQKHIVPAVALCTIPLIVILLSPLRVLWSALFSAAWGFGAIPLVQLIYRRRIPAMFHDRFGDWVAGFSVLVMAVAALLFAHGIGGKIVAFLWYGFASLLAGANFKEK